MKMIQNSLIILGVLGVLTACDLTWRKIPNLIVYPVIVLLCFFNSFQVIWFLIGMAVGIIVFDRGFMNQKIDAGDVKILMLMSTAFSIFGIVAFFIGIVIVSWYRRVLINNNPLPFAPFALAALSIVIIGDHVIRTIVS